MASSRILLQAFSTISVLQHGCVWQCLSVLYTQKLVHLMPFFCSVASTIYSLDGYTQSQPGTVNDEGKGKLARPYIHWPKYSQNAQTNKFRIVTFMRVTNYTLVKCVRSFVLLLPFVRMCSVFRIAYSVRFRIGISNLFSRRFESLNRRHLQLITMLT